MATYTASTALAPARAVHVGVNVQTFSWIVGGVTTTAATAFSVLLAKIPNKSRIVDLVETHSGPAASPADFGVTGDISALASAATVGAVNRMSATTGVAYDVSVSDSAVAQYKYLVATVTPATTTTTAVIKGAITYVLD